MTWKSIEWLENNGNGLVPIVIWGAILFIVMLFFMGCKTSGGSSSELEPIPPIPFSDVKQIDRVSCESAASANMGYVQDHFPDALAKYLEFRIKYNHLNYYADEILEDEVGLKYVVTYFPGVDSGPGWSDRYLEWCFDNGYVAAINIHVNDQWSHYLTVYDIQGDTITYTDSDNPTVGLLTASIYDFKVYSVVILKRNEGTGTDEPETI